MKAKKESKWYQTTGGIIVLLILFFPAGMYLMWTYAKWSKNIKWVITGIFALLILVGALTSKDEPKDTQVANAPQTITKSVPTPTTVPFEFDIPSLVGKNLDGVIAILGQPDKNTQPNDQQIQMGVENWDETFTVNGKQLLVTYRISDRSIVDFFLETDDDSGATSDTKRLMELGNLKADDPRYKVEFVEVAGNSSSYTGVKVTPN